MDPVILPLVGYGTGWAVAIYFFTLMMRGRMFTAAAMEKAEHEANEWRAEGRIKDQVIITTLEHIDAKVTEQGKSLHAFMGALQKATQIDPTDDGGT